MRKSKLFVFLTVFIGLAFVLLAFQSRSDRIGDEIARINKEIKRLGLNWEAGMTSLTPLSPEERRMRNGYFVPFYDDPENLEIMEPKTGFPNYWNWNDRNGQTIMTTVKDQGNCGSCWAFGTCGVAESVWHLQQNSLSSTAHTGPNLSEQELVSCSTAGDCSGGYVSQACIYVRDNGVVSESCFPYVASEVACNRCSNYQNVLSKIGSWAWITTSTVNENAIKQALQTYGPLIATMQVYTDFYSYVSGVWAPTGTFDGDHCIILVGWNDALNCWICKNSWGTGWGMSGYFMIQKGVANIGTWCARESNVTINNQPPIMGNIGNRTGKEGQQMSFTIPATDPDNDTLSFSATGLPTGASLNQTSGAFSWTPTFTQDGIYWVLFRVSDGLFTDSRPVKLTIANVKKGKGKF
jgi:hypothetical protein